MTEAKQMTPMSETPDLREVLREITERMSEFMGVERSSIFLYDEKSDELWTPAAQGLGESKEIRMKADQGIAGLVMKTGESFRTEDPYTEPRFNREIDRKLGFRTRNLFCRPIHNTSGRRIGVIQLLNKIGPPLSERDEKLLDVLCAQAAIAIENAQLYLNIKSVRASELALHAELQKKHGELQVAFSQIENATMQRDLLERRVRAVRLAAAAAVITLFGVLGFLAWRAATPSRIAPADTPNPALVDFNDAASWFVVQPRPVDSSITLLGNIEPLEIVHLTSPFRGRIAKRNFEYGELVSKGQLLARIDPTELQVDLRNARIAAIKAEQQLSRLENWDDGPEVARAERAVEKARLSYQANQRNLKELEQLSELGIIATSTLESARQQFTTEEANLHSTEEDLANIRANASEDRITIARYELENTKLNVRELEDKLARAEIYAPFSGIVILPNSRPIPNRNQSNNGFFEEGTTINQGEVLLSLGNLEGVAVRTRADEVDVSMIRYGQPVEISGDAFPDVALHGEVSYLSSQAILTNNRPYFEVAVKADRLSDEERASVRLGMTARLRVLVGQDQSNLAVPVSAVLAERGQTFVLRRVERAGSPKAGTEKVHVRCGVSGRDFVEILDGLSPDDVVLANVSALSP